MTKLREQYKANKKITVISNLRLKIKTPVKVATCAAVQDNKFTKFCILTVCGRLRYEWDTVSAYDAIVKTDTNIQFQYNLPNMKRAMYILLYKKHKGVANQVQGFRRDFLEK